jgi:membrane associated rhomboid family serine protease
MPFVVAAVLIIIIGIEAILQAADHGWLGSSRWRTLAYQFGAFWPGLLDTWKPNFIGQPSAMFVTYAFVHSGFGHLLGNAICIWSIGRIICFRAGQRDFTAVFLLATLGGALCFAALSPGNAPMVGASGALFGLVGTWVGWQWRDRSHGMQEILRVLVIACFIVTLNVALYVWYRGGLAWETHLGGFLVGFALAGRVDRKPNRLRIC